LDDVSGAGRVRIQVRDYCFQLVLAGGVWQLYLDGGDPHFRAVPMLAADVRAAARIITDEHRPETGYETVVGERCYSISQLALNRCRQGLAVENPCRHVRLASIRVSGRSVAHR